jgi:hypothetical protein
MKNLIWACLCVLPFILLMFGEAGVKIIFWGLVLYKICVWWNPLEIETKKVVR